MTEEQRPMVQFAGQEFDYESLSEEQKKAVINSVQSRQILSQAQNLASVLQNLTALFNLAKVGLEATDLEVVKTFPSPSGITDAEIVDDENDPAH